MLLASQIFGPEFNEVVLKSSTYRAVWEVRVLTWIRAVISKQEGNVVELNDRHDDPALTHLTKNPSTVILGRTLSGQIDVASIHLSLLGAIQHVVGISSHMTIVDGRARIDLDSAYRSGVPIIDVIVVMESVRRIPLGLEDALRNSSLLVLVDDLESNARMRWARGRASALLFAIMYDEGEDLLFAWRNEESRRAPIAEVVTLLWRNRAAPDS